MSSKELIWYEIDNIEYKLMFTKHNLKNPCTNKHIHKQITRHSLNLKYTKQKETYITRSNTIHEGVENEIL